MNRRHQFIHLLSLVALIASLFSPLLTLPVTAEDLPPEPNVTLLGGDATPSGEGEFIAPPVEEGDTPAPPALIQVAPLPAIITESVCPDGVSTFQSATAPLSEGIAYSISTPDADGNYTISATLTDSSIYTWSEGGLEGWAVDGNSASQSGTLIPCPEPEPVDHDPADNDLPADGSESADVDVEEPAEPTEPTIGRGPARETSAARTMSLQSTSTGMTISVSADNTQDISVGDTITYTITITNNSGTDQHYNLQHEIPTGLDFGSASVPYPAWGDFCAEEAGIITCGLGEGMVLYDGWSDEWTVTLAVTSLHAAYCQTGIPATFTGSWDSDNVATITTYFSDVVCEPSVSISMTPDNQLISRHDDQLSLTITHTNDHATAAPGSAVDIPLPEGLRLDGWTATVTGGEGTCAYVAGATSLNCSNVTVPGWADGTAGVQEITWTLPAQAQYAPEACGDHTLTAAFTHGSANASDQANITISCQPLLTLSHSVSPANGAAGTEFLFTLTVTNVGNDVEDEYSAILDLRDYQPDFLSVPPGDGSPHWCSIGMDSLGLMGNCDGSNLSPGQSRTFSYTITMPDADSCQNLSVGYWGRSGSGAWDAAALTERSTTFHVHCGMMSISKIVPSSVELGEEFPYTVIVENTGSTPYTGPVGFEDVLPPGFVLNEDDQANVASYCPDSTFDVPVVIRCELSSQTFPTNAKVVWSFRVIADPEQGTVCGETSTTVTGVAGTWNPEAKSYTSTTTVTGEECEPTFAMTLSADKPVVSPGDIIEYTLTIGGTEPVPGGMIFTAKFDRGATIFQTFVPYNMGGCVFNTETYTLTCFSPVPPSAVTRTVGLQFRVVDLPMEATCLNGIHSPVTLQSGPWDTDVTAHTLDTHVLVTCHELSIDKTVSADSVRVGEEFTYTVTVQNIARQDAAGYSFTDHLPPGLEMVDADSYTVPAEDGITCSPVRSMNRTTISCESENSPPPNGLHTYTFTVRADTDIDSNVCGEVTNTVTGTTGRWASESAKTATAEIFIDCTEYVMTKSVSPTIAEPGDLITYRFDISHTGEANADFTFKDELDLQGLSFVRGRVNGLFCPFSMKEGLSCVYSPPPVPLQEKELWVWLEFQVTGNPTKEMCTAGFSSSVELGSGPWHPDASKHTLGTHLDIDCVADIQITKSAPATVHPGETLEYTLKVKNTGNIPITDVLIVEVMPLAGVSGWSVEAPDGINCTMIATLLACESFSLLPTIEHSFIITGSTEGDPGVLLCNLRYLNQAAVGGQTVLGPVADLSDWVSTNLNCDPAIDITKTDSLDNAIEPGSTFTYEVTVTNSGTIPLRDVVVNDPLPSDVTFVRWVTDDGMSCDTSVRCTEAILEAGESRTIEFEVRLNNDLTAKVCNDGIQNSVTASGRARIRLLRIQDKDDETTSIHCRTSVAFEKQPLNDADIVKPGESIGYEITLENSGTLNLSAVIDDDLPELPAGSEWILTVEGSEITLPYEVNALPPGSSITIRIESTMIPDDLTLPEDEWCVGWKNTATVAGSFTNDAPVNAASDATVRVNCTGLSIVKEVSSPVIEPGGQVKYTITVTNQGNTLVESLHVVDDINLSTTVFSDWDISAEGAVGCDSVDLVGLSCFFESLDPQDSVVVTITANAPALPAWEQCAPVENSARFAYFFADAPNLTRLHTELTPPATFISSNSVVTQLNCQPEIDITKNGEIDPGDNGRVDAGDTISYSFEVTNTGNMTLYDIAVSDEMDGLVWDGNPTHSELLPEMSVIFTATHRVTQADIDAGKVVNSGNVIATTARSNDEEPGLNLGQETEEGFDILTVTDETTATTALAQEPGVTLLKSSVAVAGDDDVLNLGDTIEYTFTIENVGNVTLTNLEVIDDMEGVIFPDGTTIESMAPETAVEISATYEATQADVDAGIVVNCADVVATAPDESEVSDINRCATDPVDQNPSLQVVQTCPGPTDTWLPGVGDTVTYEITISNNGDQTVHNITVITSREGELVGDFPPHTGTGSE